MEKNSGYMRTVMRRTVKGRSVGKRRTVGRRTVRRTVGRRTVRRTVERRRRTVRTTE